MSASSGSASEYGRRTLADIAATLPGATAVFRRRKLDFCCGGRVPLAQATAERGLVLGDLEEELDALAALGLPAASSNGTDELISVIETRYHAVHRQELPELVRLARRVEVAHKNHPAVPRGIAALLEQMSAELEQHMQKEEQILFPLMRRGGHPMIAEPIAVMLAEHDDHGAHLRCLEALTHDFTVPDDACPTWRALCIGAKKLAADLMDHIHLENNVLFPRFQRMAAPAE